MFCRGASFLHRAGHLRTPSSRLLASTLSSTTKLLGNAPEKLLSRTDVFIFDCDGVIWKGDSLIPGVEAVLDKLRQLGKKIFFVTNNSTKSRKGYLKKFTSLGLTVEAEGVYPVFDQYVLQTKL